MLGFNYFGRVIQSYWNKVWDGTLTYISGLSDMRDYERYMSRKPDGFIFIPDPKTRFRGIDDYRAVISSDEEWKALLETKLNALFGYQPNLQPFESTEQRAAGAHAGNTHDWVALEAGINPIQIINLDLDKLERRFPQTDDDDFGDREIRGAIAALVRAFRHNYETQNQKRHNQITWAMLALNLLFALMVLALWTPMLIRWIDDLGMVYLDPKAWYASPDKGWIGWVVIIVPLMILQLAWIILPRIADYRIENEVNKSFEMRMLGSCRSVIQALILRQEHIISCMRDIWAEISHIREHGWFHEVNPVQQTEYIRRWCTLIFWLNGRLSANQECERINAKIIGVVYVGLRADYRKRALGKLFAALSLWAVLSAAGLAAVLIRSPLNAVNSDPLYSFLPTIGWLIGTWLVFNGLGTLHLKIAAIDEPQAINLVWNALETGSIKGTKESALHDRAADHIVRAAHQLMMEEEKRKN